MREKDMNMPMRSSAANRGVPAWDLSAAASGLLPARLVRAPDETLDPLAHLFVPDNSGPLRTLIGMSHGHWYSLIPSNKTGGWQPVESEGEWMLAFDCECLFNVVDYQTQAFRLAMTIDGERAEWICDMLIQHRDQTIEAVEVKPDPGAMDAAYKRKMFRAAEVLGRLGWRMRIRYHDEIRGSDYREENRVVIGGDGDVIPDGDAIAAFDRLMTKDAATTFGRLCDEMSTSRSQGRAMAHAMMVTGRVDYDFDALLHRGSDVVLHPPRSFNSRIRLGS